MRIMLLLIMLAYSIYLRAQNDGLEKSSNTPDTSYINHNLMKVLRGIESDSAIRIILHNNDSILVINPGLKENYSFYSNYLRQKTKIYFLLDDIEKVLETCDSSERLQQAFAPQPSLLSALILKDKSQCYYLLGNMKEADIYTSKCKNIFEQLPNFQDLRQYRDFLRDIGINYINFNNMNEAKAILSTRYKYIQNQINIDSLETASAISDIAFVELSMGNYEYALQKLLSAKSIIEHQPTEKKTFFYWDLLRNLGTGYKLSEKLDSAQFYFLQCNELSDEIASITPDHRASICLELGVLFLEKKQFPQAKENLEKALDLVKAVFGEDHPLYFYVLGFLGQYYFVNNTDTSDSAYRIFNLIQRSFLRDFPKGYSYLSIGEQEAYKADFDASGNFLFTMMVDKTDENYAELCYDILLARKNLLLNSIKRLRTLANSDEGLMEHYRALQKSKLQLANEIVGEELDTVVIDSLKERIAAFEKALAYNLLDDDSYPFVQTEEVRNSLHSVEICIEFFKFKYKKSHLSFDEVLTYAALILDKNRQNVKIIKLCTQAQIDSIIKQGGASDFGLSNFIYGNADIYNLIWKPLRECLVGKKKIYISTDGTLSLINLPALPTDNGSLLNDNFDITILNSTQDILSLKSTDQVKNINPSAEIYFDINYSEGVSDDIILQQYRDHNINNNNASIERGNSKKSIENTKQEGQFISEQLKKAKWKTSLLVGDNANESYIKKYEFGLGLTSPSLIHFSTHGFFFPQEKENNISFQENNDPLLRSGIIMSNPTNNQIKLSENRSDGFLTALEVSQLDLSNTDLVILSGCETGLGNVYTSEGVYGLRRAFKIAGVDKIILSLWQVPDYQTMELMNLFYINLISNKLKPKEALQNAQKTMRKKKYEPYYWAGFLIVE